MGSVRKIIHIDMDAFYAAIEQRDRPELKGKPVIVGGDPFSRGVVATCSYEARVFGVSSAMPARKAYQLCPKATFLRPRMEVYKSVSAEIMKIFKSYTDLVEPLSLDEAYLDVTENKTTLSSASVIARHIQEEIYARTKLTGSAGVSINKFIAKIASNYQKPEGLTVVPPEKVQAFLDQAPIRNFFGVGKVTEQTLHEKNIYTGYDLRKLTETELHMILGERGLILHRHVRGEDERPVNPNRIRKSIGKETTLQEDINDQELMLTILETLALKVQTLLKEKGMKAKVVTLKIRFSDFQLITRRKTVLTPYQDVKVMMRYIREMLDDFDFQVRTVRLLGISASHLIPEQVLSATESASIINGMRFEQLSFFNDF